MQKIAEHGSLHGIEDIPAEVREVFVTAHEISPEWHIKMQAAFQKHTHNAVSKTVNFPNEATRDEVKEVFILANRLGCKGVTVYRDGSRSEQVLTVGADKKAQAEGQPSAQTDALIVDPVELRGKAKINGVWGHIKPIDRPTRLDGFTAAKETPVGKMFLTLNALNNHPVELFAQIGKAGSDLSAFTEAIARLVSTALRSESIHRKSMTSPRDWRSRSLGSGLTGCVGSDAIGQFPMNSAKGFSSGGRRQETGPFRIRCRFTSGEEVWARRSAEPGTWFTLRLRQAPGVRAQRVLACAT